MKKLILFLFVLVTLEQSFALNDSSSLQTLADLRGDDTFDYSEYYQVKEDPRLQNINLLSLNLINQTFPKPVVPYNRRAQFGTWIQDQINHTCMNTRGLVLIRESTSEVKMKENGCTVQSGDWDDPYSATHFTKASDIQIDHFVPLKNAYMTGAHEWTNLKRCQYANYIGNDFHLLAVSGHENTKKGDNTPSVYLPPNKEYVCTYLKQWLEVKTIWSLRITPKEADAIKLKVIENNCNKSDFLIPAQFITEQRSYMAQHADICSSQM